MFSSNLIFKRQASVIHNMRNIPISNKLYCIQFN